MHKVALCLFLGCQLACSAFTPTALADSCPSGKFPLWQGSYLHGANIFQGRNSDGGPNGFGDGEFSQSDYNELAKAGANYVQISHAGIFSEQAPYALDAAAEENLDQTIQKASQAGLYVGIAFRSGPGRNEAAISNRDGLVYEPIWNTVAARNAWVAMLRHVATRYRGDPHIVGYSIMVEPNYYAQIGFPDPKAFYANHQGTLHDVNVLYALATAAIREVDFEIPILLEPEGYGAVTWLPYLTLTGDPKTVYTPHDYTPFEYCSESVPGSTYPGMYDIDGDGNAELFDVTALGNLINTAKTFSMTNAVPVAFTEFGVHRNAPNAPQYLRDRISLQNTIGNWAVWVWQPASFIDPFNMHEESAVLDVLRAAWTGNCQPNFVLTPTPNMNSVSTISGRAYGISSKRLVGRTLAEVLVRIGDFRTKTSRGKLKGEYSMQVTSGTYLVRASLKGYQCTVGRKGRSRRISIEAGQTLYLNVYCR